MFSRFLKCCYDRQTKDQTEDKDSALLSAKQDDKLDREAVKRFKLSVLLILNTQTVTFISSFKSNRMLNVLTCSGILRAPDGGG